MRNPHSNTLISWLACPPDIRSEIEKQQLLHEIKAAIAELERLQETLDDTHLWLQHGQQNGWCSTHICATHDGLPWTEDELDQWEERDDFCIPAVRLYRDENG